MKMSNLYYGITKQQLCKLAYDLDEANGIEHCFSEVSKVAGNDWFNGFMRRNPGLSMRVPESTSMSRVIGFRRSEINHFFANLTSALAGVDPSRLSNVDETGLSTVHSQKERVLAHKGRKQVGKMVSAEKGETVTAVCCISASGVYIPPMLIFPRSRVNDRLSHGAPPGSIVKCSPSGWINSDLFVEWLEHFVASCGATTEKKTVLLLDNHVSHVSLEAYELCRKHGVVMVSFAPHTSHRYQPLDLTVYGPLKTAYAKRCSEWMATHPGKRITQYEVAELFGEAYSKIASVDKCISGFRAAGCWPLNSNIFEEHEFSASDHLLSSKAMPPADNSSTTISQQITQDQPTLDNLADVGMEIEVSDEGFLMYQGQYLNLSNGDAPARLEPTEESEPAPRSSNADTASVSVFDLSPIPQPQPATTKRKFGRSS
jgi:DDE superfamily endonuclease